MAIGDHAVDTERLPMVMHHDHDIDSVHLVCCEVSDSNHRVLRGDLLVRDGHLRVRQGISAHRLPNDHVAGPQLLALDRALDIARLKLSLAELLPTVPKVAVRVLRKWSHLLAVDVRFQSICYPAIRNHRHERIRVWQVVAAKREDPLCLRAEVLHNEQHHVLIVPSREFIWSLQVLLETWLPCQSLNIVALGSHAQHDERRIGDVEVRSGVLGNV
mmetsp:Transcript_5159/g.8345  ORF Transcript_5159/g.8345 Transcript_5159/m.8345 type:complete len:216 (-) Transcript_5159:2049-2696(-)